ncbi:rod shape-determining protein MreC [Nocardioides bruguierae]|uniref:Cell shape-determining protein MreC n=1 Tax=Nocardioides bruguierae TaxID=2945102 RepID=A0A9X2D5E8_9ACTN|nr:rod shape-determining protein MreC [Nocardioides bruguierae]MCM0619782.1 rod shape-determining protein MreC [Nocardioides bruguierae]
MSGVTDLVGRPREGAPHDPLDGEALARDEAARPAVRSPFRDLSAPEPRGERGRLGAGRLLSRVERRERRWSAGPVPARPASRSLLVALVLASATVVTLDLAADDGPVGAARAVVADVVGPLETATAAVVRPVTSLGEALTTRSELEDRVADLEAANAELRDQLAGAGIDQQRLAAYDALAASAGDLDRAVVPARVVGWGAAQTFTSTVTIDAGTDDGVVEDATVIATDGLVGRVLRADASTATVLLVTDAESTVGARVGSSGTLGFLSGTGEVGDGSALDLELVDATEVPDRGEEVLTWGSQDGAPYLAGIRIGRVTHVYSSVRDSSIRVEVAPSVDMTTLDVVGVVVPTGTDSARGLITGSLAQGSDR